MHSRSSRKLRSRTARRMRLKDLIDQSLLVQRGKDMGISVETDVIKRLDQIRIQNNLSSMEDLEKAVSSHGLNWEDFKDNIRKSILTQKVISQEVGSHITIGKEDVAKYYDEHKSEFVRPEQVALREIEVSTEGKKDSELPDLKKKAETALKRVKDGEDFGEIAKRFSDGSTAKQGGFLGVYKRGELSKELEDTVFKMKKNDLTDVLDTKQGYLDPSGPRALRRRRAVAQQSRKRNHGQDVFRAHGAEAARLSEDPARAELRRHQARLPRTSPAAATPKFRKSARPPKRARPRRAARNSCSSARGWHGFRRIDEDRLCHRAALRTNHHHVSSSFTKKKSATRAKAAPISAWNSATAAAPSKPACGISSKSIAKDINRDDFVKVQARVEIYRNRPQLARRFRSRLAKPEEIDLADYLPHTAADVEKMWAELLGYAELAFSNPWLKKLVLQIVTDPGTAKCYKRAPAAKVMHHAYIGGLLEHVVGLCGMAKLVAQHYPELDVDLLAHRRHPPRRRQTRRTLLRARHRLHHRASFSATSSWNSKPSPARWTKSKAFPLALKTVVQHLLISHHGQYEFGSPKLPMIREAMVFHYLDDLDSKLAAVRVALASGPGDDEWSAYSGALGRKFLKLDAFLKTAETAPRQPEQLPLPPANETK